MNLKDFKPPDNGVVGSETSRRRTAVGATTIVDAPGQPLRIGVRYPEVYPLALDSPRLCLSASADHGISPFIDFFRNADGSGQIESVPGSQWRLQLDGLLASSTTTVVTGRVELLIGYDDKGEPIGSRKEIEKGRWTDVWLDDPAAAISSGAGAAAPAGSAAFWLRLSLDPSAKESVSLAFDPPRLTRSSAGNTPEGGTGDSLPCNPDTPPVLLVGASSCWSPAFSKPAEAQVVLPRTTWLDWEHWCGNRALGMYGSPREQNASKDDAFSIADGHLLTASVLRSLDDEINRFLDRLPDPSVPAVIAELTVIDAPLGTPVGSVVSRVIDIGKAMSHAFGEFNASLASESKDGWVPQFSSALKKLDKACRLPVEIRATKDGGLSMEMAQLEDTTAGISPGLRVTIPEGTIARLTIRPFVPWPKEGHPAFHDGIKELAVGEATIGNGRDTTAGYVFEGASLTIEAMADLNLPKELNRKKARDEHSAFLKDHIEITPIPQVRDYRVMFVPQRMDSEEPATGAGGTPATPEGSGAADGVPPDPWRLFSHVEMRTQRWRFSGRPIYGWINPKACSSSRTPPTSAPATTGSPASPAIELDIADKLDPIREFEAELFFDRDDADCEFTRVRLTGGRDELLACPWELPSATYFRHAFNFVSRYAGAMQPGQGTPLWPPRQADWSRRVAMLADAPRLEVTRPQMRCIVPLTTSPDGAEPVTAAPDVEQRRLAPTAPVACILEERPFAVGGLAERMLGEIVTGVGYGFDGKEPRVQPLDFAKETSRDGRLDAWGWTPPTGFPEAPSPARSFIVETEGPIGLHFEEVTTPAPAWSNCQYLLRPRSLRDERPLPEESFLGVQLRRFLDPEWIFDAKRVDSSTATTGASASSGPPPVRWPLTAPCIARHKLASLTTTRGSLLCVALGDSRKPASLIDYEPTADGATLVIKVNRSLLGAHYPEGSLPLCEIPLPPSGPTGDVALLHIPHGDGSFSISIALVPADDDAAEGRAKAPLIVGTARWTLAHLLEATPGADPGAPATPAAAPSAGEASPAASPATGEKDATPAGGALEFPSIGDGLVVEATAMSQPTYREWTRTAKNADFVTVSNGAGSDFPVGVAGIRARVVSLTDERGRHLGNAVEFRLSAGQDRDGSVPEAERTALWLCDHLANRRMPLFVHRYLVGVFTSVSTKGSRTYQSFAQASLLVGRRPLLPAATDNQIDSLTLHEMEVPARRVAGGEDLPANLEQFKVATIDLKATGGLPPVPGATKPIAYRLHVRFANSQASMTTTTANVQILVADDVTTTIEVPPKTHSLIAMWTSADKKPLVRFVFWDGTTVNAKAREDEEVSASSLWDKVEVKIASVSGPAAELWADVSLLHRPVEATWKVTPAAFDEFIFDWLFSSRDAGDDRSPATRTLSSTLASRVEAQGRFISSSQPIAIDPS